MLTKNIFFDPSVHPKLIIAANQDYYDRLFSLLSTHKPSLIEPAWELSENNENWKKILDPMSTNKLLYSLKIISQIHSNKKDPKA
jgi:hypothetical protein